MMNQIRYIYIYINYIYNTNIDKHLDKRRNIYIQTVPNCSSIYLSIYLPIYDLSSIYLSIYGSIPASIHPSVHPSIHPCCLSEIISAKNKRESEREREREGGRKQTLPLGRTAQLMWRPSSLSSPVRAIRLEFACNVFTFAGAASKVYRYHQWSRRCAILLHCLTSSSNKFMYCRFVDFWVSLQWTVEATQPHMFKTESEALFVGLSLFHSTRA